MNKNIINLINKDNKKVLNNLHTQFNFSPSNTTHEDSSEENIIGLCPIGIEIEVKWRDYFPELFDKYLKNASFKDLSNTEKENLTQDCYILEDKLLPILNKVIECGIEKGADKYWEFAFPPTSNISHTVEQIKVLNEINAIPEGKHSLHLTIGGINNNRDTYYLLLLLEVLFCDKERLQSAFHKDNKQLSSTWARKGMGGVFLKDKNDLKYDFKVASELRTLELSIDSNKDSSLERTKEILSLTSYISDLIYTNEALKKENKDTLNDNNIYLSNDEYIMRLELWKQWKEKAQLVLVQCELADENWKKPNLSPQYWNKYIKNFDIISEELKKEYNNILKDKIINLNEKDIMNENEFNDILPKKMKFK